MSTTANQPVVLSAWTKQSMLAPKAIVQLLDGPNGKTATGLTYARSGAIVLPQQDGSMLSFAANAVPRAYNTVAGWHYRFDPSYTQSALQTHSLSNASWTKTAVNAPAQNATGPNGTTDSWGLTEDSTVGSTHAITQSITFANATNYTITAVASSRTGDRFLTLVLPAAAFTSDAIATFNLSTGAAVKNATALATSAVQLANGNWLLSMTALSTAAIAGVVQAALHRSATASIDSYNGNGSSGVNVWCLNVTNTAYQAPVNVSTGVTSLIGAPSWSATLSNLAISLPGDYTLYAEYFCDSMVGTYPTRVAVQIDDGSAANRALLRYNGAASAVRAVLLVASASTTVDSFSIAEGTFIKQAMRVGSTASKSAANASLGSGSALTPPAGLTTLRIGTDTGSNVIVGGVKRVWVAPYPLTDAQLQAATT